mmetsp:Transcript_39032/g.79906  ORF Transcript_39032/g.79906 Transcript_39032/m.79906 type:complete len:500 (+) Transcript_39032:1172-2671(+)
MLLERLDEGGLELREEGLHHDASLLEEEEQRLEDGRFDLGGEAVADDADEGPAHLDDHGLERRLARALHELAEPDGRLLARLRRRAVHERLEEEGQQRGEPLGAVEARDAAWGGRVRQQLHLLQHRAHVHAAAHRGRLRVLLVLGGLHVGDEGGEGGVCVLEHGLLLGAEEVDEALDHLGLVVVEVQRRVLAERRHQPRAARPRLRGRDILQPAQELKEHHAHALLRHRHHHLLGRDGNLLGVVTILHPVGQRAQNRGDLGAQRLPGDLGERAEGLGVGGGHGRGGELGDEEGEDDLAAEVEQLAEALQRARGVVAQLREQRWHHLLDRALPNGLEQRVERHRRRGAHLGLAVAQRNAHRRHDVVEKQRNLLAIAVGNHLAQPEAHAGALQRVLLRELALEDGDDVAEHALAEFANHLAHSTPCHCLLLLRGRGKAHDERVHEHREDGLKRSQLRLHDALPHLEGSDANRGVHVGAEHVDGGKQLVAALDTQHLPDLAL